MNITRTINGIEKTLAINAFSIEYAAPGGVSYVCKLSRNADDVIRINKTCISTCNPEMLVYMLQHDGTAFHAVFGKVTNTTFVFDTALNEYKLSRPAFYAMFNDDLSGLVDFFSNASHATRKQIIRDHCCSNHDGKMQGIISYSSSVLDNPYCISRRENCPGAVCGECFACSQLKRYKQYQLPFVRRSHVIATCCKWEKEDIPHIDPGVYPFFRFESFGDIMNVLQFENYNLFAAVNAKNGVNFTLWSKNPGIIQRAINNGLQLADNLRIGLSSLYLNTPEMEKAKRYSFIHFLFTVYTPEYITENNIQINCGGRSCITCRKCYEYVHEHKNGLLIVNEELK